ncbi:adenylyl-sulfate kinase [Ferviditalea candida]|uniref:Adenylyl-sulfate kinase n=1 Tax=Ferviditalea candida TaxID=3108399 RepID=A0ABU5ZD53_9BACL|nr:adenylyl-sulfate kinase [Paenibacillaceae bacterium T2]
MKKGVVIWFTSFSGAGKTTICGKLVAVLRKRGEQVEMLDGDLFRMNFSNDIGYSESERFKNIERAVYVAKLLSKNGIVVLASFFTPYQRMRDYCRKELPDYVKVYVKCSLKECIRRDVKGLYSKALKGEIQHFTGISDPFEEPVLPDLILDTEKSQLDENVELVINFLKQHKYTS